jgi:hypothetical protein
MTDETLAEAPAPEPVATAAPEAPIEQQPEATKTFTQEEVDAIVTKRLAKFERKLERERALREQALPPPPVEAVTPDKFASPDAYAEALAAQKAEELLRQREMQKQQREILDAYSEREEEARNKYEDFEQVAYNPSLPITTVMAQTIQASDIGPEVAYYLGANPKEAERISKLAPFLQAKEIGKVEAKLAADPPVKKSSSAPAPISPVTAKTSGAPAYDTTDPRSMKAMSTSEWIAAERLRQIKKLEAARSR